MRERAYFRHVISSQFQEEARCEESGYVLETWMPRIRSVDDTITIPVPGAPQALDELVDELVSFDGKQEEKIVDSGMPYRRRSKDLRAT